MGAHHPRRQPNTVNRVTEDGSVTARLCITNTTRFATAQQVKLTWDGTAIDADNLMRGAGGVDFVTIAANQACDQLVVTATESGIPVYYGDQTHDLIAVHRGVEVASAELTRSDKHSPPQTFIEGAPEVVLESEAIQMKVKLSVALPGPTVVGLDIQDPGNALLAFSIPDDRDFGAAELERDLVLGTVSNTVQDEGVRLVTITLQRDADAPYTLGSPHTATIKVVDDDTPPQTPANLRAAPDNRQIRLTWDLPPEIDQHTISSYQVRYAAGAERPTGNWAGIPESSGTTTSHVVGGLANNQLYTFDLQAINSAGRSPTRAHVQGTPRAYGVTISRSTITEGESTTIAIVPRGAPFSTTKVIGLTIARPGGLTNAGETDLDIDGAPFRHAFFNTGPGNLPQLRARQSLWTPVLSPGDTSIELTVDASEDAISECRETFHVFAALDGQRITTTPDAIDTITIFDDDNRPDEGQPDQRPTVQSATVDGRTVTLTFSGALAEVNPGDDPYLEEGDVAPTPQMFFTLFEAKSAGVVPPPEDPGTVTGDHYKVTYGTAARTFSLDGDTVTLTFPHRVDTTYGAWVRYDQSSRYSPLGIAPAEPKAGQCVAYYGVADFTQAFAAGANTAADDPLPVITINDAEVREGAGPMVFTVTMSEPSDETVRVDFRTIARSAKAAMRDTSGNVSGDFWPVAGTLLFAPGQITKMVSVRIVDDNVEDDGETFLLDLHSASGATMDERTSYGTGTIANSEDAPTGNEHALTASFANVPAEHGGPGEANRFTFDLIFSEAPQVSYATLRDHAFTVTGGDVKRAKRKAGGSNRTWTIHVEPHGWSQVAIRLNAATACTASDAVCTTDDRALANSPSATVAGPAALSVADASANENTDDTLNFVVSLDKVSTLTVSVDYATSDGSATAGADYTATSGTLTFNPGDAAKSISVPILDDAIDDGGETLTLTLSNATNARIADGTATGTIENADPLQRAWIARFGRTVASDVVDGITDRLANPRASSEVRVAGVTLQQNGSTWTEAPVEDVELGDALEGERTLNGRNVTGRELLLGSAFHLQGERDGPTGTAWAAWGRFSTSSFEGKADGVTLSGDVVTGLLGADISTDEWTAGVALSAAKGDGPFELVDDGVGSANGPCDRGTITSTLTSVHPYAQVRINDDVDAWAIGGYGSGGMTIDHTACETFTTDIGMTMAAAGLRGRIMEADAGDAFDAAVRTDVLWLRATSERTERLLAAEADVTRLRLMIDARRGFTAGAGTLTPSIEAGVRHDAGDAEEGVGFELGAGLAYQAPRFTIEAKARTLVAHDDAAYREWGASAAIRIDPGGDGRGMSLSITPTWGSATSETEQLWSTRTAEDLVGNTEFEAERHLDAELRYGLAGPGGFGVVTPYTGLSLTAGAERAIKRAGVRWKPSHNATVGLEATREESAAEKRSSNALILRGAIRF